MVKSCTIWNDNQYTDNYRLGFDFEDDKKPDKIVLSNRDDDRGYNNPVRWEFEIVDKKYVDDADANLQRQITENATRIADHETRITNNEHTLADHETRITDNTHNITLADSRITQNSNDLNGLNLRVGTAETEINNLKLFKQHPLDKVFNVIVGQNYYRLHSYLTYIQDGKAVIQIEIDFYTENGINLNFELYTVLPWINLITLSPYHIENVPCCGVEIPLSQTPTISNQYAIVFDKDIKDVRAFTDVNLGTINQNGSTTADKMMLNTNTNMAGKNVYGRIFLTATFTY